MKVLYNWLKEFVPLEISPQETADLLAKLGFEIASLRVYGGALKNVITAEVLEVTKHPNADRLSLCKVNNGKEILSVVCGAPNVRGGIKVAFAQVGATLPNGDILKAAKIRGIESQGMICSAEELGLDEKSDGILILPDDTILGQEVRSLLGLDDALIELDVTPNRRDVLGVLGVARELSAGLGIPLRLPEPRVRELDLATNSLTLSNEVPLLCPRYIGRLIKGVQVKPSPQWLSQRLTRCGIRSINNLVDITNYVMLELGQPLHVFDAERLENHHLKIRLAKDQETLLTLEGKTAALKPDMLVIADAKGPVALAGVMGGELSAVQATTQDIVLESAAFAPSSVRRTSKVLGIRSESSYRFERGSDLQMVAFASRRAAQLVQELAGGLGFKPLEASTMPPMPTIIKLQTDKIRQFLGLDLRDAQAAEILRRLGCVINSGTSQLAVTVPSWRLDIVQEADVLEEIARLYGYDNIPARVPTVHLTSVPEATIWDFKRLCATHISALGYFEAMNTSTLSQTQAELFVPGFGQRAEAKPIALANPLSLEQALLRTSLIPGLLQNACLNFQRQIAGVRLFELGRIFYEDSEGKHESNRLGILAAGQWVNPSWRQKAQNASFHDLSGTMEALAQRLRITRLQWSPLRHPAFHPRRAALFMSGKSILAWVGEIHPDLADQLDRKEPMIAGELDVEAWLAASARTAVYQPIPAFPPINRDLSFVVPIDVTYEKMSRALRSAAGSILESETLIDLYQGEKLGADKKSMTFSLVFRHPERTLVDAEIEKTIAKIRTDIEKQCGAVLRS